MKKTERVETSWTRLLIQGGVIGLTGIMLAVASVLQSDTIIMGARYFSWLPVCGMVLLAMGLLECVDAFFANEQGDFLQNLQVGSLDTVVGVMIIMSVAKTPEHLNLLLAAFLLVRGIVRIALTFALELPQMNTMLVCGAGSIMMGLMIWLEWPNTQGWFLALCLNIEIAFRGWSTAMYALWVKEQQPHY